MQVMQRVNGINKTLLNQVTRYKTEVATRQSRLAKLLKAVRAQQAASAAAKRACSSGRQPAAGLHQQPQGLDPEDPGRAGGRPPARRRGRRRPGRSRTTTTTNLPAPPSSTLGGQAVAIAEQYLGVPYV